MRLKRAIIFLLIFFPLVSNGQYYDMGQDPGNINWMKIETENFEFVYPGDYGDGGIIYAKAFEKAYTSIKNNFPPIDIKIPVVIHSHSIRSNGTVVWAPRRVEIFPMQPQNSMPVEHVEQLAFHELTHVFQMASLERGFTKFGKLLLGEQFPGAVAIMLPTWYLEGHAVLNESVYTPSGRGRSASFQKQLKAISAGEGGMFKYDKLLNGSYRDYVPDYYHTGYQVVASAILENGNDVWTDALDFTAKYPFSLNPFHFSLKSSTGLSKRDLVDKSFRDIGKEWAKDLEFTGALGYEPINEIRDKEYLSYYSPVFAGDNHIGAIKTSLSRTPQLVFIDRNNGSESVVYGFGSIYPYYLSGSSSKLVWVETEPDPRWEHRSYSVIKVLDIKTGKARKLTSKSRYLAASISPDGRFIVAVENMIDNTNWVVIMDSETGNILERTESPGNLYLERPHWSVNGEKITFIFLSPEGEGIITASAPDLMDWEVRLDAGREDYQSVFMKGDTLYFVSSVSGIENGYILTPEDSQFKLTNSRFGATDLISDGKSVWFSDYTSLGNKICSTGIAPVPVSVPEKVTSYLIDRLGNYGTDTAPVPESTDWVPERYKKGSSIFNLHSWFPMYVDLDEVTSDFQSIKPGLTLLSQNLLSTVISWVGYEYSGNRHQLHSELKFQGKYPVFRARIDYGGINSLTSTENGSTIETIPPEIMATGVVSVPLLFSSGRYYRYFVPSLSTIYVNRQIVGSEGVDKGQIQMVPRIYFYNYHSYSRRDIYPRFGQFADIQYFVHPFDRDYYGSLLTIKTAFFFPGGIPNSGIRLRYETDYQNIVQFTMANRSRVPRGFSRGYDERLHYISVDYAIPLLYPDLNISSLVYIKRIRGNLFYDNGYKGNSTGSVALNTDVIQWDHIYSKGIELMADLHLLRIPYEISTGVRSVWTQNNTLPVFEAIFSMDIHGTRIGETNRR